MAWKTLEETMESLLRLAEDEGATLSARMIALVSMSLGGDPIPAGLRTRWDLATKRVAILLDERGDGDS